MLAASLARRVAVARPGQLPGYLRVAEYLVGSDPAPDDMRRAGDDLIAVGEGGAAVRRESDLPDVLAALHAFDP